MNDSYFSSSSDSDRDELSNSTFDIEYELPKITYKVKKKLKKWKKYAKQLVEKVLEDEKYFPFHYPVDIDQFPDYLQYVKQPMDLRTILNNFKEDLYETSVQFSNDMRLIYVNSRSYNTRTNSKIYRLTTDFKEEVLKDVLIIVENDNHRRFKYLDYHQIVRKFELVEEAKDLLRPQYELSFLNNKNSCTVNIPFNKKTSNKEKKPKFSVTQTIRIHKIKNRFKQNDKIKIPDISSKKLNNKSTVLSMNCSEPTQISDKKDKSPVICKKLSNLSTILVSNEQMQNSDKNEESCEISNKELNNKSIKYREATQVSDEKEKRKIHIVIQDEEPQLSENKCTSTNINDFFAEKSVKNDNSTREKKINGMKEKDKWNENGSINEKNNHSTLKDKCDEAEYHNKSQGNTISIEKIAKDDLEKDSKLISINDKTSYEKRPIIYCSTPTGKNEEAKYHRKRKSVENKVLSDEKKSVIHSQTDHHHSENCSILQRDELNIINGKKMYKSDDNCKLIKHDVRKKRMSLRLVHRKSVSKNLKDIPIDDLANVSSGNGRKSTSFLKNVTMTNEKMFINDSLINTQIDDIHRMNEFFA